MSNTQKNLLGHGQILKEYDHEGVLIIKNIGKSRALMKKKYESQGVSLY